MIAACLTFGDTNDESGIFVVSRLFPILRVALKGLEWNATDTFGLSLRV